MKVVPFSYDKVSEPFGLNTPDGEIDPSDLGDSPSPESAWVLEVAEVDLDLFIRKACLRHKESGHQYVVERAKHSSCGMGYSAWATVKVYRAKNVRVNERQIPRVWQSADGSRKLFASRVEMALRSDSRQWDEIGTL